MKFLQIRLSLLGLGLLLAGQTWAATPQTPPANASGELSRAEQLWAAGKLDEAQALFSRLFEEDRNSVAAGMKLAGMQLSRQNYDAAIETYQRVIGIGKPEAKAWIGLGLAQLHTGKPALAHAAFEEALKIEPGRQKELGPLISKTAP